MGCLYALTCTRSCLGCSSYKAEEYAGHSEDLFDQEMEDAYRKEENDYWKKIESDYYNSQQQEKQTRE